MSCTTANPVADPQLVIDGWIENGGYPVIQVTSTAPLTNEKQDAESFVIKWARVSVSDGEKTVVLTGKYDPNYYPPFIYTTSNIKGEEGKRYSMEVQYRGEKATASTVIPRRPRVSNFIVKEEKQNLYSVSVQMAPDFDKDLCYVTMANENRERRQFYVTFLGVYSGREIPANGIIPILRPILFFTPDYTTMYSKGDWASLKLSAIDNDTYSFWKDYEEVRSLSRIPMFPAEFNARSNISGGLGHWTGINSVTSSFEF